MSRGIGRTEEIARMLASSILITAISLISIFGCTHPPEASFPSKPPMPAFPPQKAMESGDYSGFLAENQKALEQCDSQSPCDVALFNLGFVYSYSKSPYYNQGKGVRYFDELMKRYPQSHWAFQAKAWTDIIKKSAASEGKRRKLQSESKEKDATIEELKEQIKRSREVDLKIEQKERELIK